MIVRLGGLRRSIVSEHALPLLPSILQPTAVKLQIAVTRWLGSLPAHEASYADEYI